MSSVSLEVMSYLIPGLQVAATVLLTLFPERSPLAKVAGCALLLLAHVVLIVFGWVGDFGGFRFVQLLMPPTVLAGLVVQLRQLRQRRSTATTPSKQRHTTQEAPEVRT